MRISLFLPERREGRGSGHLRRSLELMTSSGRQGRLYLPVEGGPGELGRFNALVQAGASVEALEEYRFLDTPEAVRSAISAGEVELVVFDQQELGEQELSLAAGAPLRVGIDTGGGGEEFLDVTIHALPRLPGESCPNLSSPGYLNLPARRREQWPEHILRVLVTLGGEDASGLAPRLAGELAELFGELRFFYTEGGRIHAVGADTASGQPPLREELAGFDLVILHYGMTLFEALYARVPVLALPVSDYHRALAEALDLDCTRGIDIEDIAPELGRIVVDPRESVERCRRAAPQKRRDLSSELDSLVPPGYRNPLFPGEGRLDPVVFRLPDRSYYRCSSSGLLYMRRFRSPSIRYEERYFFEEYRRQYGRTYLEDFEGIRRTGVGRLRLIRKLERDKKREKKERGTGRRLLDVGCAYGPFLKAAEEAGYLPFGIDVAEQAVAYVTDTLGYPASRTTLEELDPLTTFGHRRFEVITMWYVIEHIPDLPSLLSRVAELLLPGGVFAFSTPNGEGVSATTNREDFLRRSPEDHLTIWEPTRLSAVLEPFGFEVERVRVTGHHPERFPLIRESSSPMLRTLATPLLRAKSKLRGLGDTFECYCRRRRDGADG